MTICDEKERENCKKVEGKKGENQSREPPLAGANTWLDLPVCPHDSQSGQQTHNKRDRNIPHTMSPESMAGS